VSAEDGLELDLHLVGVLERRSLRWLAIDLHLVGVLERRWIELLQAGGHHGEVRKSDKNRRRGRQGRGSPCCC
jgi:hypothetical protein